MAGGRIPRPHRDGLHPPLLDHDLTTFKVKFSLAEENPVLLASQHGNQVCFRVGWHIRLKSKARLHRGPGNRGSCAEESAFELLRGVFNMFHRLGAIPLHVEGDLRVDREDRRDGRSGKPQPLREGVGKVVVVEDVQVAHAQPGPRVVEVNLDRVVPHRNHPEHIVPVNVHVIVVDLLGELGRSNWTGEQVQSNMDERAFMLAAVRSDKFAMVEPHVRLERQRHADACRVCSGAAAPDVSSTHEPVEVGNMRLVVEIGKRFGCVQSMVVDENSEGFERRDALGNRIGTDASEVFAVLLIAGVGQPWTEEARSQHHARGSADQIAPREPPPLKRSPQIEVLFVHCRRPLTVGKLHKEHMLVAPLNSREWEGNVSRNAYSLLLSVFLLIAWPSYAQQAPPVSPRPPAQPNSVPSSVGSTRE